MAEFFIFLNHSKVGQWNNTWPYTCTFCLYFQWLVTTPSKHHGKLCRRRVDLLSDISCLIVSSGTGIYLFIHVLIIQNALSAIREKKFSFKQWIFSILNYTCEIMYYLLINLCICWYTCTKHHSHNIRATVKLTVNYVHAFV